MLTWDSPAEGVRLRPHPNPFVRFRELLLAYRFATALGLSDAEYVETVDRLDSRLAAVDGKGLRITPAGEEPKLAARVLPTGSRLWIKDETVNVAGSHKARHLMGIALSLEFMARCGRFGDPLPELAIASCGNAALAAGVLAAALAWPLRVFLPPEANPRIVSRLRELGARIEVCERGDGVGDPCYRRFRQATARGAIPFSCQGPDNVLALDGGRTLGYELAERLAATSTRPDRICIQIGGGAFASSVVRGLEEMATLGFGPERPRVHAVQTRGAYPLARAWRRLLGLAAAPPEGADGALAAWASEPRHRVAIAASLEAAIADRRLCMWPWEAAPRSLADGILDDETYDWLAVVKSLVASGGWPVIVSEEMLDEANAAVREHTAIRADHTGTAGLAGLMTLSRHDELDPGETVVAIVTGLRRSDR